MADIVLRSPFTDLRRFMDDFWDDDCRDARLLPRLAIGLDDGEGTLALDIEQKDGAYIVTASVPGFKHDEITVRVNDGALTIAAERSGEREEHDEQFVRRERYTGSLVRRVSLPGVTAHSEVDARVKNGVLTLEITVPEDQQSRKIEVKED